MDLPPAAQLVSWLRRTPVSLQKGVSMASRQTTSRGIACCAAMLGFTLLAGCSSSFGGGGQPAPNTIVVPPGTAIVCQDGSAPPCP